MTVCFSLNRFNVQAALCLPSHLHGIEHSDPGIQWLMTFCLLVVCIVDELCRGWDVVEVEVVVVAMMMMMSVG